MWPVVRFGPQLFGFAVISGLASNQGESFSQKTFGMSCVASVQAAVSGRWERGNSGHSENITDLPGATL